jgi:hypothetical protein
MGDTTPDSPSRCIVWRTSQNVAFCSTLTWLITREDFSKEFIPTVSESVTHDTSQGDVAVINNSPPTGMDAWGQVTPTWTAWCVLFLLLVSESSFSWGQPILVWALDILNHHPAKHQLVKLTSSGNKFHTGLFKLKNVHGLITADLTRDS